MPKEQTICNQPHLTTHTRHLCHDSLRVVAVTMDVRWDGRCLGNVLCCNPHSRAGRPPRGVLLPLGGGRGCFERGAANLATWLALGLAGGALFMFIRLLWPFLGLLGLLGVSL